MHTHVSDTTGHKKYEGGWGSMPRLPGSIAYLDGRCNHSLRTRYIEKIVSLRLLDVQHLVISDIIKPETQQSAIVII